ncbi:MAG: NADH-quinone oxidoreductase subunit J [Acidimicrobiales bacterium]
MIDAAVFFVSAAIILAGGVGVIVMRNPVHSALSLVMTLFGVAVLFVDMEAYFLAAVQVIVYAGAIVVLFLFVIMLIGVDRDEDVSFDPVIGQRQLALLAGAAMLLLVVIIGAAFSGDVTGTAVPPAHPIEEATEVDGVTIAPEDNIRQLARVLFTDYVFAFEITALLLTVAVIGAVILARKPSGELAPLPDVEVPWPLAGRRDPDADVDTSEAAGADDPDGDPERAAN